MRWLVRGVQGVLGVALLLCLVVYCGSEWMIRARFAAPRDQVVVPHDPAAIAEGARLGDVLGCRGCHGSRGQGDILFDKPGVGRIVAPPLARAAAGMSDADLVRAIRYGVHRDGTSLFVMHVDAFRHIADEDLVRLVAWLRKLRPGVRDVTTKMEFGPIGRVLLLTGTLERQAQTENVSVARRPADAGRYFVETSCLGCHRLHEEHDMGDGNVAPPLAPRAAGYDMAQFRVLLRTGVGVPAADLGIMSTMAREHLRALSDTEIAQVHAYLTREATRAER